LSLAAAVGALVVILIAPGIGRDAPQRDRLRVTVIDVGQGDAILVQTPDGHALLVDAGGTAGEFDIGGRIVTPALWALGVRRLDWMALSHGDRDHVGGASAIVLDMRPREIWEGVPVPRDPERHLLRELATNSGVAWRSVHAGARLELAGVTVEAIHPPPPDWERQRVRNDDSLVFRVSYRHVDVWLTGDAGAEFEARLPADAGDARVRILKVGHHGSRTSTSQRLVSLLRPHIAIVSAGRGNLFGHPAPDVLARLANAGTAIFRTDRDGATVIETDGVVARVRSATGRSWYVGAPGS
jgi:competence protein ComEC